MNNLDNIKENLLNEKTTNDVSTLFKTLSDPTRITILFALKNKSLSVTELSIVTNMSQSAISHQLRVLRNTNLVVYKKVGKEVIYSLSDQHIHVIFNQAIEHVEEDGK